MSKRRDCIRAKAESKSLVILHPNLPSSEEEEEIPGPQRIYRCSLCPNIYLDQEDLKEHCHEIHDAPMANSDINRQLMGGQRTSKIEKKLRAFRKKAGPFKSAKRLAEQRKTEPVSGDSACPVEEEAEKTFEEKEKSASPPPAPEPAKSSSKEFPALKKQRKSPLVQVLVVKSAGNGKWKLMPYCSKCKNCFENLLAHQNTCKGPKEKNVDVSWPTVDLTQCEATVIAPQDWIDAEMTDCSQIQSEVAPTVSAQPVPLQLFRKKLNGKETILSFANVRESRADMMPTKFLSDVAQCETCLAAFKSETALLWHRRRCHECQFCTMNFISVGYLEQHLVAHHFMELRRIKHRLI